MLDLEEFRKIKKIATIALFKDDYLMEKLVFKGGSCLELAYKLHSRSSKDIDFSMADEFDGKKLKIITERIKVQYEKFFPEIKYFPIDIKLKNKPIKLPDDIKMSGYALSFKLIGLADYENYRNNLIKLRNNSLSLGIGDKKDFVIEISKHEYCEIKEKKEIDGYTIYVYPPMLIIFEKLRAICQKMKEYRGKEGDVDLPRSRDFYDINLVNENLGPIDYKNPENRLILKRVFEAKNVDLLLMSKIKDKREIHESDFKSVLQTDFIENTKIQIFDYYFEYVLNIIEKELEEFWIK